VIMEKEQEKLSGFELVDGETCEVCGCMAGEHDLDGCSNHPKCLNFYRYYDFEYLAEGW